MFRSVTGRKSPLKQAVIRALNLAKKIVGFSETCESLLRPRFLKKSSHVSLVKDDRSVRSVINTTGNNQIICLAWNSLPQSDHLVCFGQEQSRVTLCDVNMFDESTRRRAYQLDKWNVGSNPQEVAFSSKSPSLFVGCQTGKIKMIDYRCADVVCSVSPTVKSYSIDCLKVLRDDNYVLCSHWNGEINLTDVRMRKIVSNYQGHVNNHSKLRFVLNDDESFLYAVGSDCYLRVWDVRTCRLEREINVSDDSERNTIPCLAYSNCWGGEDSLSGLVSLNENYAQFWTLPCG